MTDLRGLDSDEDGFGAEDILASGIVSRETLERLTPAIRVFRDWSAQINLVSASDRAHLWQRHIWDSCALLEHIPETSRVIDIGSGSGFPGLVVQAHLSVAAHAAITYVESIAKKARYLQAAAESIGGVFHVKHSRFEELSVQPFDVITARAVAGLEKLVEYTAPWLETGGFALFPKGRSWQDELTSASRAWTFDSEILPNRASPDGRIIKIWNVQPKAGVRVDRKKNPRVRHREPERRRR